MASPGDVHDALVVLLGRVRAARATRSSFVSLDPTDGFVGVTGVGLQEMMVARGYVALVMVSDGRERVYIDVRRRRRRSIRRTLPTSPSGPSG